MKLKKAEIAAISVTLLFLSFTAGYFVGQNKSSNLMSIETQYSANASVEDTVIPEESINIVIIGKININTASADELTALKGIGDVLAQRIIDYRTEHGVFERTADIMNVSGIGEGIFSNIEDFITVENEGMIN